VNSTVPPVPAWQAARTAAVPAGPPPQAALHAELAGTFAAW